MKADSTIPPEALEASAQAIFDASPFREAVAPFREQSAQYQALTRAYARAACLAMLKNWPGMRVKAVLLAYLVRLLQHVQFHWLAPKLFLNALV